MYTRSMFMMMLAVSLSLPAFANITAESVCDVDTLGIYSDGGTAKVEAIWIPSNYTCATGQYLNASAAACVDCPAGSFCGGFEDLLFNDSDQGLESCPQDYTSGIGAGAMTDCYFASTVSCALKNPFDSVLGHGTANYANATASCKTYYGDSENCILDDAADCAIVSLNCAAGYEQVTENEQFVCSAADITCPAGTYLKAGEVECSLCEPNSYCVGNTFNISSVDQGMESCEEGLTSLAGAASADDCGRVLHVGQNSLQLHAGKYTTPSLAVSIDGKVYYANMTPIENGAKPMSSGATETLHIKLGDVEYTVHDTNVPDAD